MATDPIKALSITDWRDRTGSSTEQDRLGIVGDLFEASLKLFRLLLQSLHQVSEPALYRDELHRCLGTLYFWGDGFGAAQGLLDKVLDDSTELRETVLILLISLAETLLRGLSLHATVSPETRETLLTQSGIEDIIEKARYIVSDEPESPSDAYNSVQDVVTDLETYLDCLCSLNSSIESPLPHSMVVGNAENPRAPSLVDVRPIHQDYTDLITARFPQVDPKLAENLGKANWDRYQRMQAERLANAHHEMESLLPDVTNIAEQAVSIFAASKFHDSGLGSSLPAQSVYAETIATVISSRAEGSHTKLPPLTQEAKDGKPFICDACNRMVTYRRTRHWKTHIFQDLLPYLCVFLTCSHAQSAFKDHSAWINHLGSQHGFAPRWESLLCPVCSETTESGRNAISLHLGRHMEEIALAALPHGPGSDGDSDVSSEATSIGHASLKSSLGKLRITSSTAGAHTAETPSGLAMASAESGPGLIPYDVGRIKEHVLGPILADPSLESFHSLVKEKQRGIESNELHQPAQSALDYGDPDLDGADQFEPVDEEDYYYTEDEALAYNDSYSSGLPPTNGHFAEDYVTNNNPRKGSVLPPSTSPPPEHTSASNDSGHIDQAARVPTPDMTLPPSGYAPSSGQKSLTTKSHKCPYCSKDFVRHHNLKSHLLSHSQEKPYECTTCQARFRRLHDLKRHAKLHTGERPHICPKCGRRFARENALARHGRHGKGCRGRRAEEEYHIEPAPLNPPRLSYTGDEENVLDESIGDDDAPDHDRVDSYKDGDDDTKYCVCRQAPSGDMVDCDNEACPYQWFHLGCVGLTEAPVRGEWLCPDCRKLPKSEIKKHASKWAYI